MSASGYVIGVRAIAAAIQHAIKKARLPYRAVSVLPNDETVEGEIEMRPESGGNASIALRVGAHGASLSRYEYRADSKAVGIVLVKGYDRIVTADICRDIVALLQG